MTGDSRRYLSLADSLINRVGFGLYFNSEYEPEGFRLPGYPLFIGLCRLLAGGDNVGIIVVQGILFMASVWLIWRIAANTFGDLTGILFLALSSVYPFIAYSVGQISPEIPCVFLVSLAFYLLTDPTPRRAGAAAFLIALSAYFRPNLLLLTLILAIALVIASRQHLRAAISMVLIAVAVSAPWAIRNYLYFGVLTPVQVIRGTGNILMIAAWQSRVSTPTLIEYGTRGSATQEAISSGMIDQIAKINQQIGVPDNTIFSTIESYPGNQTKIKADRIFMQAAMENIIDYPAAYLKSSGINFFRMWFSAYFPDRLPGLVSKGLLLEGIAVFFMSIAGIVLIFFDHRPTQRPILVAAVASFLYFSVTLCWLHTEARYTIPIRLVFLVFAAHLIAGLSRIREELDVL